jgi:hypothetical protein
MKDERIVLHTVKEWEVNWIGPILRRHYLLKHLVEGRVQEGYKRQEDEEEDVSATG